MMAFRTLKAAVVNVLGLGAGGRFRVIGYKQRGVAADELTDELKTAQVFYTRGEFPKSGGSHHGPNAHDCTVKIDLAVAKASTGDLAALSNPAATAEEFAVALSTFQEAADGADAAFDGMADDVYQILMDGRNLDLGLPAGMISNRWVAAIEKNGPTARGEYVVMSGSMDIGARVEEQLRGDFGTAADDAGAVLTRVQTNIPDSTSADPAPAGIRAGG